MSQTGLVLDAFSLGSNLARACLSGWFEALLNCSSFLSAAVRNMIPWVFDTLMFCRYGSSAP